MSETTKLKAITIRIPEEIHAWLARQAKRNRRSLNAQIILVMEQVYEQANEQEKTDKRSE